MFRIERTGLMRRKHRLWSDAVLCQADFVAIAGELGVAPSRARKVSFVAACRAQKPTPVETRWKSEVTTNEAKPGDWIAVNLGRDKSPLRDTGGNLNRYVISAEGFPLLYRRAIGETAWGPIFEPIATVEALELPGGLDIKAPWGERQTMDAGHLLSNGRDVYGIESSAFCDTYAVIK